MTTPNFVEEIRNWVELIVDEDSSMGGTLYIRENIEVNIYTDDCRLDILIPNIELEWLQKVNVSTMLEMITEVIVSLQEGPLEPYCDLWFEITVSEPNQMVYLAFKGYNIKKD